MTRRPISVASVRGGGKTKTEEGNEAVNKYHVATAAEAIAAAQFARLGCNIAVQYGANQPEYDLMIDNREHSPIPVSVKGS